MNVLDKIKAIAAKAVLVSDRVSDDEAQARMEICATCAHNKKGVCDGCGCILEVKVTARINWNFHRLRQEVTHCPHGFWNDSDIAKHYNNFF